MKLENTSEDDKDDLNNVKMDVLDSIKIQITSEIKVKRICAYMTNSKCHDEYNVVRWNLLPYILYKRVKKRLNFN